VTIDKLRSQSAQADTIKEFETLFQEHWPRIYAVIFRIVGDPDEAEDIALETFLKLHGKMTGISNLKLLSVSSSWRGWLYRVGTNLGLNALRARKRRDHYELEAGRISIETVRSENPAVTIERVEQHQRVRQVLSEMKPRSAKILVLRHSGLSYAEIADAVKVSPKSVGKLLSRAEKEFERLFKALEGE
jgi:RNA polymerase sigma-70 factor (ECF subfamily)